MFYHEEISRIQGVLNSNLKFPAQFVDLNGTITSAKDGGTLFDLKKYLKYKRVEDSEKITGYHPNPQIIFDNTSPEGSEWRKEIIASIKTDGTEQQPLPATTVAQEEINTEQIILATGHYSARPPVSGEMHQEPESAPQKPFEGPEEENGEVKFNSVEQKPDSVTSTEANVQAKEQIDSRAEARETIEKLYQWTEEVVQTWSIHGLTQGKAFEEKISSRFNNSKRLGNRLAVDVGLRGVAECIQETHDYWTRLLPRLGNKVNDNQLLNLAHTMQDVIKKRPQNAAVQSLFAQQYVKNAFNNADILERASDQLLAIAEASYDPNLGSVGTDSLKRTKDTSEYSGDGLERRLQQEASAFEQQLETTASQERAMKDALRAVHEHLDDFARELSSRYNQNMEPFMDYSDLSRLKRGLEILEAAGGSSKPIATQELEDALSDIARAFASVENTQQGKYEDGESLRKLARRIEDAEAPLRTLRTAAENSLPDSDAAITINKIIRDSESVANYLSRVRRAYEEIVN